MRYYCLQGLFKGYNHEVGNVAWGSLSGTTLSIIKALLQGHTGWNSISHQSLKSFKVTKVHSSSKWNAESWARRRICFLWHLNYGDGVGLPGSSAGLKKGCGLRATSHWEAGYEGMTLESSRCQRMSTASNYNTVFIYCISFAQWQLSE